MSNTITQNLPQHPFWQFSLHVYQQGNLKNALLSLQDTYKFNINIVLFCCWTGYAGYGRYNRKELQHILENTALWHEKITVALRYLRNRLGHHLTTTWTHAVREAILKEELEAEHVEQLLLADLLTNTPHLKRSTYQRVIDAQHNLQLYCKLTKINLDQDGNNVFYLLLSGVFPNIEPQKIANLCNAKLALYNPHKTSGKQLALEL